MDREFPSQKDRNSMESNIFGQAGGFPSSPRNIGSDTSPRTRSRGRSITPDQLLHDDKYDLGRINILNQAVKSNIILNLSLNFKLKS